MLNEEGTGTRRVVAVLGKDGEGSRWWEEGGNSASWRLLCKGKAGNRAYFGRGAGWGQTKGEVPRVERGHPLAKGGKKMRKKFE